MKNEVNRTFTVKKNKFTNFLSCFYANTPQNTGGGNSHSSTVVTPIWKGSRPTVSRRSTDSQSQDHRNHTPISKALKYAAMILMVLTLGIGNAWGDTGDLLDINFTEWYNNGGTTEGNAHYIHSKSSGDYLRSNVAYFTNSAYSKTVPSATNYVCVTCSTSTYNVYAKNNSYLSEAPSTYSDSYTVTHNSNTTAPTSVVFTLSSPAIIELLVGASSIGNTDATYGYTAPTANATKVQREYHFLKTYSYATGSYPLADEIQLKTKDAIAYVTDTTTVAGTVSYEFNAGKLYSASGTNNKKFYIYAIRVTSYSATPPSCSATANAGADKSTTVGVGVAMAATAASTGYTGAWSIKSGSPSTSASQLSSTSAYNATFTPSTYGTYTLVWTVTDDSDGSCSASDEATVTVPAPTHSISYTNTKDMDNSANPTNYTEGVGVASFAKLRHVVGYDFSGWSPASISSSATTNQTIEAQWTAKAVAEGTGTLTYAFGYSDYTITTSSITRNNGALYDATDLTWSEGVSINDSETEERSGKITTTKNFDSDKYLSLTFKIAEGYTFTPTEVQLKAVAVTTDKTIRFEFTDNAETPNTKYLEQVRANGGSVGTLTYDFDASDPVTLTGTVTVKIYAYGATDSWRLGTPITITGTIAVPATPCAATAPGDIEKGEASGGTGKITLKVEDDGEPVTGDAWYWQSSASGEAKTDVYDAENGKEVSAAGTYYLRSYNTAGDCWSAAKSVEVEAADLLTAISPTLSYDANVIVGNTASPTLEGNAGSGSVTYALNDVTPAGSLTINESTGVVTPVTVGGTATVTATIAANGGYAGNTATSGTITVVAPATGTATISYALSGSTTTGTVAGVSTISSLSSSLTLSTLTLSGTKDGYSGEIVGCTSTEALDEDDYVDVQFTVASGYAFTPSAVTVQVNPIKSTSALKAVVKIMDAQPLVVASNVLACEKTTDNEVTFASGAFTDKEFEGTVHIRMYFYGAASDKTFYIKSPITITGTVAVAVTKYNLSFAAGTGASGSMSTLKYAEGAEVTLPACTFTAPSGKEFDAWVVTKTVGGASVTVEDGVFTMPAEAVTATATWKDLPAKYKVEYYDGESKLGEEEVLVGSKPTASGITTTKEFYTFAAWQLSGDDIALTDASWVSVAKDATVTLKARYTGQYTSGSYEFVNTATVGTNPSKTVTTSKDTYSAFNIDNLRFSGMDITYESGASTALNDYKGWKINTQNATIKFLVENNSQVKVAIGRDNTAAVSYTALNGTAMNNVNQEKSTEVAYSVKAGTIFTISMTTGNTITLKRITISPLYNATYTDETGDASGSDENVTEVTLPTPSETTVGSYSFTGWVATQTVYDGETPKTAGEALNAGGTYTLTATTTFTAQWALISDFDVKFFQGYGDPDVQIGETQKISTGEHAEAPETDPTHSGYRFLGWSYDGTEAHIVEVASYTITAATNFTAMWVQQFSVTFDGAGEVVVDNGAKVSSPDSPVSDGKVFQGWYNDESKYDFSAVVTGNLALESKWVDADANHYQYAYNDAFHFDGVVYKTPEGKTTDPEAGEETKNLTTPYTMFSGAAGITSIVATKAIYDYKKGADTKHVTAYLKLKKDDATSNLAFTVASGYTAVLTVKMGGYSNNPTVTLKKGDDVVDAASGTIGGTATGKNYNAITYNLTSGEYVMTSGDQTLYFSHIDLEATAIPAKVVTYKAGEGTGDDVVDNDATEVADCPNTFTAPEGKVFNGWKDALDNDVTVGDIVSADMTLTAQWIYQYAVTFNLQGHGTAIATQNVKQGEKATEPNDPSAIGWDFGGWFTDVACTEGNEFDFNTAITADRPLFAKWTAFDGCTELWPATSGEAPTAKNQEISLQSGSKGGKIYTAGAKNNKYDETFVYTANGLGLQQGGADSIRVELNNDMQVGTVITVVAYNANDDKARGFKLLNMSKTAKATMTQMAIGSKEYTYTVVEGDGLAGTNKFLLQRSETSYLTSIKVENCGDEIIYHDLTSAVNIAGKGTVTLGAESVREGYTTTATYSDIDPLYEFVSWSVSGEGASIEDASANPAVITMGTADAVVTLNLQLIPVRYTVTYMDGESTLGTEDVDENGHPTASEIATAKEGYIFEGWYNDAELLSGPVTLSSVTITAAKTFYGKWVSDGKIRLIANGALNTTDFVTGGTLQDDASYTVEGTTYAKNVQLGNTCSKVGDINNYNKVIMYNTQTDATNIKIALYDPYSSATTHHAYIVIRQEGNDTPLNNEDVSINTGTKRDVVKEYNITGRATVYVMVSNTNVRVCQVEVTESGSANAVAPAVGYSVNLNKGRMVIPVEDTEVRFEGISYNVADVYQPARTELKIKTTGTHYISFTIPAGEARQLQLTTSSTSKYAVSQTKGDVTTLITPVANEAQTFNLGEGTWYINPNGSNVSITSIAFDAPQYDLNDDTNVSAILPGADVTVNNGVSLNVDVVKTIHDLTISSKAGASGQITGTVTNLTIAGDLYMDVRFFEGAETLDDAKAGRWYMISAPFDVNLADGFYKTDGTPMVFGQTDGENIFDLFEYDGNKRATTGVTGWKRVQGKMKAGRACLIGFNPGQPTTIRLKAASTVLSEPTSITLGTYEPEGYVDGNQNWNGVANPTMHYTDLNKDVQTYNNEDGENGRKYIAYTASSTSFVVGTAFFVQATGTIDLTAASHSEFRAPQRQANERYEACVRIFRQEATDFADQMYVRASENASNEYEQGHDMITWNGTTANTALIWAENYGKRLAIEEAPMVNDKATYNLGIFVPVAGTYRIEVANPSEDATLYLTKNGRIFWNLTMGACELDLAQGQNNEYGLVLRAEAPAVTTGMDEIRSEAGVQKLIIDENVFILRGEQLFDMTGKAVK